MTDHRAGDEERDDRRFGEIVLLIVVVAVVSGLAQIFGLDGASGYAVQILIALTLGGCVLLAWRGLRRG